MHLGKGNMSSSLGVSELHGTVKKETKCVFWGDRSSVGWAATGTIIGGAMGTQWERQAYASEMMQIVGDDGDVVQQCWFEWLSWHLSSKKRAAYEL